MTTDDLQAIRSWVVAERAGNAYLASRGQMSGNELAIEHITVLLAEVDRLRGLVEEAVEAGRLATAQSQRLMAVVRDLAKALGVSLPEGSLHG